MLADRQQLQRGLRRLVGTQHGYFTAAQALQIGYSYQAQKYHVDRGNWQRVDRAVFRLPDWPGSEYDHLTRWSLWAGPDAVVSHESALEVHGLGDVNPARLHLTVPAPARRRNPGVVLHQDRIPASDIEERDGFRVSRPARALAESAMAGLAQDVLDGAIAEALAASLVTPRAVRDAAARLGTRAELGIERALNVAERSQ